MVILVIWLSRCEVKLLLHANINRLQIIIFFLAKNFLSVGFVYIKFIVHNLNVLQCHHSQIYYFVVQTFSLLLDLLDDC